MSDPNVAPIRVPKTAEIVASRIRKAIVQGRLKNGDSLPSEAQMLATYEVSRPTLREALRILESQNLVSTSRGSRSGARVVEPTHKLVAEATALALQVRGATIGDLYEARLLIEPPAAGLAAGKRAKQASAVLSAHVAYELSVANDVAESTRAAAMFHSLLLEQCGNLTLSVLGQALQGMVERHMVMVNQTRPPMEPERRLKEVNAGFRSHEKLVAMIAAGDVAGAEAHWRRHMEAAGEHWLDKVARTSLVDLVE